MKKFSLFFIFIAFGVALSYSQVTITGKVILDDGNSPENVKVVFKQTAPAILYDSTYTDANGDYSKELIKGIYDVTFSKIGYDSKILINQSFYVSKSLTSVTLNHYDLYGKIKGVIIAGTYIASDIIVDTNDTLLIMPGVTIKFYENRTFDIKGRINALGTELNPIIFTTLDNTKKWSGVKISNSESKINNSIFEYSNGDGLKINGSNSIILDRITSQFNNTGLNIVNSSNVTLKNSTIKNSTNAGVNASGTFVFKVLQSIIMSNQVGVLVDCQVPGWYFKTHYEIYNSVIAYNRGDGVHDVSHNLSTGGKLYNSIIYKNGNFSAGYAVSTRYGVMPIGLENCVVWGNYSLFFGLDSWIGNAVAQNENAIESDIYFNIYKDPLFKNALANDFELTAGSPCIDAGKNTLDTLMFSDFKGNFRYTKGNPIFKEFIDVGLFEYNSNPKTRMPLDIGSDTLICRGSSITINPSGHENYFWSNQKTTDAITINSTEEIGVVVSNPTTFGFASENILASTSLFTTDPRFKQSELAGTDYSRGSNIVQFADIDNDNDLDMIYFSGNRINYLKNNAGKFLISESHICPYGRYADGSGIEWTFSNILAKDLNKDGNIEIIATISGGTNEDSTWVYTYKNNKLFNITERYPQKFLNLVDYNNDGFYDTNTSKAYAGASLSANRGNGVFDNSYVYTPGRSPWEDFNSDGFKDAFSGNVLKANNKDFTFTDFNINGLSTSSYIQNIGDFDNDGKFDLIERQYDSPSNIRIFKNNGNFSFTNSGVSYPSGQLSQFTPIDYNNDGKLDFIDGNDGAIYENSNNFTFTKKASNTGIVYQEPSGSSWQYRLRTADFNNDNGLDLYYNGSIYLNNECLKNTKPSAPTNLKVTMVRDTLKLSWDRATDFEQGKNGLSYNFYVGTSPGKDDIVCSNSNLENGYRKIVEYGNASLDTFALVVRNFKNGTYYFGVQAIDNSFVGSEFSEEMSFDINNSADYLITATASQGGGVNGSGVFNNGDVATLTAMPNPMTSYIFTNWTENGEIVSTSPNYSFIVSKDRILVANFRLSALFVSSIFTTVNPVNSGTVINAFNYENGSNALLIATANSGYNFVNWTESGSEVSTNPSYSFTVSNVRMLVANFSSTITGFSHCSPENLKIFSKGHKAIIEGAVGWDVKVIDINGKTIRLENSNTNRLEITIKNSGLYLIYLTKEGQSYSKKVSI